MTGIPKTYTTLLAGIMILVPLFSSARSIATAAITQGFSCAKVALNIIEDETQILLSMIGSDPNYINQDRSSTQTFLYGSDTNTGAYSLISLQESTDKKSYLIATLGNRCGCFTNTAIVGKLRSNGLDLADPSDLTTRSVYAAVALCDAQPSYSPIDNTFSFNEMETVTCTSDSNTTYFSQVASTPNTSIRVLSGAEASVLCSEAAGLTPTSA